MKEKAILIISIVVGVIAMLLSHNYLKSELNKLYKGARKVDIIVAVKNLPSGTVLTAKDLAFNKVYAKTLSKKVFNKEDANLVMGKKLIFGMDRGDPLLWSLIKTEEDEQQGLAPTIKPGLRAIAISVGGDSAVSGHIKPHDRIDIIGSFSFASETVPGEMEAVTLTVLQDVLVLATGRELAKKDTYLEEQSMRASTYNSVTLEVTPREAELLTFAQNVGGGSIKLTLRHPTDTHYEDDLPSVNFDHIETKLQEYNLNRQIKIHKKRRESL